MTSSEPHALSHPSIRDLLPPRPNGYCYTDTQLAGWVRRGLRGRSGDQVRLRAAKIGGQYMVTPEDVLEFLTRTGLSGG